MQKSESDMITLEELLLEIEAKRDWIKTEFQALRTVVDGADGVAAQPSTPESAQTAASA